MKPVIIIPSRFASERFPGKPLAMISKKPMIQWVYEAAQGVSNCDRVLVATDDERIQSTVLNFGGQVVMTSPQAASGSDRIAEAAQILDLGADQLIINLQGDQPLIRPQTIQDLISAFEDDPKLPMATLAIRTRDMAVIQQPKFVKVVLAENGDALYFSRAPIPHGRDRADHDFFKHIGVYAYRRSFLEAFRQLPQGRLEQIEKLEQLRVLESGYRIRVIETDFESPDVDLPGDIAKVEALIAET